MDPDDPHFRIGGSETGHLVVCAVRRGHDGAADYLDGNWVAANVRVAAGGFRAELVGSLRAEEFVRLRNQLRPLAANLAGAAKFETVEDWLTVEVIGDGKGHFHAGCVAVDVRTGDRLTFGLDFDQTELPEIVRGLDGMCEGFPVVGKP